MRDAQALRRHRPESWCDVAHLRLFRFGLLLAELAVERMSMPTVVPQILVLGFAIRFTPSKEWPIPYSCAMGMVSGELTAE